jgi:hypothetical protein
MGVLDFQIEQEVLSGQAVFLRSDVIVKGVTV